MYIARYQYTDILIKYFSQFSYETEFHNLGAGLAKKGTLMPLSNRIALVTGAAGAIGRAAVKSLIEMGAHVVLFDINAERLCAMAADYGSAVTIVPCDLEDLAVLEAEIDAVLTNLGKIDVLVNCAGVLSNNKLEATTLNEWNRVFQINVNSSLILSQMLVPSMAERGFGRIINVSSYAAKCGGLTAGTSYTASKCAMVGLTFSVAREFAGQGVTANAIAPAYVMSPMILEQLTEGQREELLEQIPVKRFCTPEEVAHSIAFLASPLAGFITGEVIDMNGGLQFD